MCYKSRSFPFLLICFLAACLLHSRAGKAQSAVDVFTGKPSIIGKHTAYLEDKSGRLTIHDAVRAAFTPSDQYAINFGLTHTAYWLRFTLNNRSDNNTLLLEIKNPTLTHVSLYTYDSGRYAVQHSGETVPITDRAIKNQNPVFRLHLKKGASDTYYLRVKSKKVVSLPVFVGTPESMLSLIGFDEYIFGIYTGIILIMILYNFFIYLTIRDKDYLYYIFYITWVGLTQAALQGYTFKFLWPGSFWLAEQSTNIFIAMSGISSLLFVKSFLDVKSFYKSFNIIFNLSIAILLACIVNNLLGNLVTSQRIIQINSFITSIIIIICGLMIQWKGSRPAIFFNISWMFFVVSVLIYILKDTSILPYNNFTNNVLLLGSAIEIALLSFALADKINIYKKEKEISQAEALQASREKEQLVREQNVLLEEKVRDRTSELEQANGELHLAMNNLKKAESQLVHAEKMASLGQLTAGIAHEINNPINFVRSNVKPLKLDIQDLRALIDRYKQVNKENIEEKLKEIDDFAEEIDLETLHGEMDDLLAGIEEGSNRTADIVKGLRTFSRVDEDELKEADIHAGIDATLTLINNMVPPNLSIVKKYDNIPLIECHPGRLNQVFMNILTNAIQATAAKPPEEEETITITTTYKNKHVLISIEDTGIGIPDSIKNKIFDPFFTTKDVGEGTGLGLSMAVSIIEKHQGDIQVYSEEGKGSRFLITLPVKQTIKG